MNGNASVRGRQSRCLVSLSLHQPVYTAERCDVEPTEGSTLDLNNMSDRVPLTVLWEGKPGREFKNKLEDLLLHLAGIVNKANMSLAEALLSTDQGGPNRPPMTPGVIVQNARVVRLKLALVRA